MTEPEQVPEAPPAAPEAASAAPDSSRAAKLVDELEKIRADAIKGLKAVLRVMPPHSSFTYAGITVTDQPTTVAEVHVPALMEAAANSGVTITQEA